RIQPQADLRQFHRHGVQVNTIYAAFQHSALQQRHAGQSVDVNRDFLALHVVQDVVTGLLKECPHRVLTPTVEEVDQPVADVIDHFDEEMPAAHGRVEDAYVQAVVHEVPHLRAVPVDGGGFVPAGGFAAGFYQPGILAVATLGISQTLGQGRECAIQHRANGMAHDVLDDVIRRVVAAG